MSPEWERWADKRLPANEKTVPGWRVQNLRLLLDACPALAAAFPESITEKGQRTLVWLAHATETEIQGVAAIITAAQPFDPDELQGLGVTLHAANHFLTRWAAGDVDLGETADAVGAGVLIEMTEEWRDAVERRRPKTTPADRRP